MTLPRLMPKPFMLLRFFTLALVMILSGGVMVHLPVVQAQSEPASDDEFIYLLRTDKGWTSYLMNADGSDRRPVTRQINFPRTNVNIYSTVFSPDQTHLIIAALFGFTAKGEHRLYRVDANGKGLKLLWNGQADYLNPVWSPQGDRIAFWAYDKEMIQRIYIINSDGSGLIQLDLGELQVFPRGVWSPSGDQILFVTSTEETSSLSLVNVDGSGIQTLVEGYTYGPDWSPSSGQIAFVSGEDNTLYVINPDGSGLKQLTDVSPVYSPRWSPDGTKIVFLSEEEGQDNLYMINADRSDLTQLTQAEDQSLACPQWLPNGEQLILLVAPTDRMFYDTETNIYAIQADGSGDMTQLTDISEAISLPNCGLLFG